MPETNRPIDRLVYNKKAGECAQTVSALTRNSIGSDIVAACDALVKYTGPQIGVARSDVFDRMTALSADPLKGGLSMDHKARPMVEAMVAYFSPYGHGRSGSHAGTIYSTLPDRAHGVTAAVTAYYAKYPNEKPKDEEKQTAVVGVKPHMAAAHHHVLTVHSGR